MALQLLPRSHPQPAEERPRDLPAGYLRHCARLAGRTLVLENDTRPGGGLRYFFRDHLGSTQVTADYFTGAPVCSSFFHPFGQSADSTGCDVHTRKFTSKERDSESGLDYFGARYYDSIAGRFASPDPTLKSAYPEDPRTWNRYVYVLDSPIQYIDPLGDIPRRIAYRHFARKAYEAYQRHAERAEAANGAFYDHMGIPPDRRDCCIAIMPLLPGDVEGGLALMQRARSAIRSGRSLLRRILGFSDEAAEATARGLVREQRVAELTGGQVARESIVTPFGSTDIDVLGPAGELITVGGPAKALSLSKFGEHLKRLTWEASQRGVQAKVYLKEGTAQEVIDLAKRWVGGENVVIFK